MSNETEITKDVPYAEAGGRQLLCDIYKPADGASKHVGILHIHGGGGTGGSKEGARLAASMAQQGYIGIAMQYRLAPDFMWPAQLEDVKTCLDWMNIKRADLGLNSSDVALMGYSVGAQIAFIAAGSGAKASACVCLYTSGRDDNATANLLGEERLAKELNALDPAAYIKDGFPPTQLFHGNADTVVAVDSSFDLYRKLTAAGVSSELHVLEGVNHGFEGWPEFATPTAAFVDLFLERHVVAPRSYRERPPRR